MKFKKTSLLVKLVILALVVYAAITLVSLRGQIAEKNAEAAALSASISATEQENKRIQEDIDALGTDEGVEAAARSKLGLVGAGEIVFHDVGN